MKARFGKSRVTVYCTCGDSMTGWVAPPGMVDRVKAVWTTKHKGEGHGPATREQALGARARRG